MNATEQIWFTKAEAAEYLRVSEASIDRYARMGRLPRYRIAGLQTVRFAKDDLEKLIKVAASPEEATA